MSEKDQSESVDRDEFDDPLDDDATTVHILESDLERVEEELYDLRGELSRFEQAVEDRTVERPRLESELRRYVRQRMRRQRARGWGPYIVLLYGTIMTVGAFYFLDGIWALLAMVVIWLSTLGLYVVMLGVGAIIGVLGLPSRVRDAIARRRSKR